MKTRKVAKASIFMVNVSFMFSHHLNASAGAHWYNLAMPKLFTRDQAERLLPKVESALTRGDLPSGPNMRNLRRRLKMLCGASRCSVAYRSTMAI